MLSCGNKVSPASLLTTSDMSSSAEAGHVCTVESQHSQVSLFSGSDIPSSLELFSQPLNQSDTPSDHAASQVSTRAAVTDIPSKPSTVRGKKYFMKYLSLSKHPTTASSVTVASNNDTDPVSSKVQFEAWVDKQQGQLERSKVVADVSAVISENVTKLNANIDLLKEDIKISMNKPRDEASLQWEKQTMGLLTRLLQGQEETNQMMIQMQNELSQQRNMLNSLSSQLSSMSHTTTDTTNNCLSSITEKVIQGLVVALQPLLAVPGGSVGSISPETSKSLHQQPKPADQAVPADVSLTECTTTRTFYSAAKQSSTQATSCPRKPMCESSQNKPVTSESIARADPHYQDLNSAKELADEKHSQTSSALREKPEEADMKGTVLGKRKSPDMARLKVHPTSIVAERRRSNRIRKPFKHYNSNSSPADQPSLRSKIKRKVSKSQMEKGAQESNFIESPVNALSDAIYSETSSLEILSGTSNSQNIPPSKTTRVKFHRRNEAAKRRKLVMSSLTDPELLLQELQDCILNRVGVHSPGTP